MLRARIETADAALLAERLRAIPGVAAVASDLAVEVSAPPDAAAWIAQAHGARFAGEAPRAPTALLDVPPRFFEWQVEGARTLASGASRGLVWSCGLGKTAAALVAARALRVSRALVVTRAIGRDVWARDAAWAAPGREVAILIGRGAGKDLDRRVARADAKLDDLRARGARARVVGRWEAARDAWALVVGWEVLDAWADSVRRESFPLVIFDESHMAKGRTSRRFKAARVVRRSTDRAWLLTATPVRNRLPDLWPQLHLVAREAWRSSYEFVMRYCDARPGRWGGLDTTGKSNVDELRARLLYWFDVRTRALIANTLPAKTRAIIRVPMSDDAMEETAASRAMAVLSGRDVRGIEAAIADAARVKANAVTERVAEALIGGEKVVLVGSRRNWVAAAERAVRGAVRAHRATAEKLWLRSCTGAVGVADRQALAREFLAQAPPACLVATLDSISESIDLHDADRGIVAALPYTPGQVVQFEGRLHRLGQQRKVAIDYFVAEGTIDEAIERVLLGKMAAVEDTGASTEGSPWVEGWKVSDEEAAAELRAWLDRKAESVARASMEVG